MDIERIAGGLRRRLGRVTKLLRPTHPKPVMVSSRTLTDEAFIGLFDLDGVKEHLRKGNVGLAKSALLDHYLHRDSPSWPTPPKTLTDLRLDLDRISEEALIQKADSLVDLGVSPDGRMPETDSDGNIEWTKNPTTTPEWLWRLNRHGWWPVLGLAYNLTGSERYAEAFEKQLLHWIRTCRPPLGIDEKSACWRLMETAMRMRVSWIPSFALFLKSKRFSPEARLAMLRSIYDHGKFLSLFKTGLNHLLREINGLACVSVYFPEFKEAGEWLDVALSRLEKEIQVQVHPDGSHVEVSTGYQWLVVEELETLFDLLREHCSSPLVGSLGDVLKRMYEVLAYVIRPDWTFPEINDGFLRWKHDRLVQAAKKFERSDFLFVGSAGAEGLAPARCSTAFEDAGWYVMRSGWSEEARYLFFDAGPHGGHHGHEDKLSVEVYGFGQSFIVDSGSYTYEKEDPYRAYFVGSQGHNAVLVNGLSQIRRWMDEPAYDEKRPGNFATWISNDICDYVSSRYSGGYAQFGFDKPEKGLIIKDVKHTRHVVFVKPDYWILVDEIEASHPYSYEMLFHTPPGIRMKEAGNKQIILSKSDEGPGLCIIPAEPESVDVSRLAGSEAPIQGWYSIDHLQKTPSNVAVYRCNNRESALLFTLLFPYGPGQGEEHAGMESIEVEGGDGKGFRVAFGKGADYLMFSRDRRQKRFGGYESSGDICVIRTDREGQVVKRFDIPGIRCSKLSL
jgi:hypothetical protein